MIVPILQWRKWKYIVSHSELVLSEFLLKNKKVALELDQVGAVQDCGTKDKGRPKDSFWAELSAWVRSMNMAWGVQEGPWK